MLPGRRATTGCFGIPGSCGRASSGVVEPATGRIDSLVLAHGYASRSVSSPVPNPVTWDSISRDIRAQLTHDMFGFGFDLVPAAPQIEPGYLTTVAVPSWVEASDQAVVILDFTDWNGPVYALITWSHVVPADLVEHLERYVEGPYEIFCAGRSGPMRQEGEELTSGTVIRVSPLHRPPVWGPTLAERLADTRLCANEYWCMKNEVQSDQWRILGEHCARVVLHQGGLDDALYNHAASAMHCLVEALAFRRFECALPAGHLVQYGATLLGVVAGARRPRTTTNDSQGHFTFFDCRPVGGLIQFLYTRNDFVPIAGMSQYLGLRVPPGYQVRYQSECVLENYIPTCDGAVVTVAFVPIPDAPSHNPGNSVTRHIATVVLAGGGADESCRVLNRPEDVPAQQGTEALTFGAANIGVSIFTPRYKAEIVSVEVFTPCDVDDFLCAVQSARQAPWAFAIDHLLPVDPQPSCSFASVLAMPEWAAAETFALIDARRIDGRLFCSVLDNHLARHDLLQHVGVADTPELHLYIAGKLWPRDTSCTIAAGCLITLCQGASGDEPWYVIEDLLASANGWTLPCPRFPGPWPSVFWVLSNNGFSLFAYQPGRGTSAEDFTDKVCRTLGYCARHTALCSASPRIADASYMGQDCRGVVVVTENLADAAPETTPNAGQPCVVFLDRRAILVDPTWVFAASGTLSVDSLTAQYEEHLPEGFALVVKGGRQFTRGNGTFIQVERRDVIILESVRDFLPESPQATDSSGADSDQDEDGESSDTTSDPSQALGPADALLHHGRDRSRSSRATERYLAALPRIAPWVGPTCKPFRVDALGHILDALFGDSRLPKVDASTSLATSGGSHISAWTLCRNSGTNTPSRGAEPLRDVTLHLANGGSERTDEQGPHHDACNTTAPHRTAPSGTAPSEGGNADTASGSGAEARHRAAVVATEQRAPVFVTAHFLVIAQDFTPEMLQIRFPVPSKVADVMRLLDGARLPEARDKFPRLCPVFPQPWRQLAVVLAGPAWPFPGILVAVDLSNVGGAVFALVLPPRTDKTAVMRAAGVSADADVLLFLRDVPWAIPADAAFEVSHGDLLQFLPARYPLTHPVSIDVMLLSSADWDLHWLPEGQYTPALWILAGHEHLRFVVRPFRSLRIRQDLAALLNVPAGDLILRPASPQVQNHAHRGHLTQNVVVAVRADPGHTGSDPRLPICIIDARALHSGFAWYALPDGILRHRTLLDQFGVRCPAGYMLGRMHPNGTVDAIRSNLRVQDGEVIVLVFFIPPPIDLSSSSDDDDDVGSGRPEPGDPDETEDTTVGSADTASEDTSSGCHGRPNSQAAGNGNPAAACADDRVSVAVEMCGLCHCQEALAESRLVRTSFLRFLNLGVRALGRGLQNLLLLSISGCISAVCFACRFGTASMARMCYCLLLVRGSWAMQTQDVNAKVSPEACRHPRPIPTPCRALQEGLMPRPYVEHQVRSHIGVKHPQPARGLPREGGLAPAPRDLAVAKRPIAFWKREFSINPHPTAAETILGSDIDAELAFGDVKLGFTARHLHALFRPQFRTLSIAECLAVLPQDRQHALLRLVRGYGDDLPDGLVCYTDGSFFPATQTEDPSAGWSCVLLDKTRQTCDVLSGKLPPWCAGANVELSAFKAECCALAVALWLELLSLKAVP